ncbi:MAG TPA: hypothetical protein VHS99_08605 [Chloroflexota bacterium]|nr:hypothetical protein [Chloroflexota bacterium]
MGTDGYCAGSPQGHVGYDLRGTMASAIEATRRGPSQVILLHAVPAGGTS